ncbi:homoserine kinase, partial [bacterium]|nr:homoserine kinase [bacterium]
MEIKVNKTKISQFLTNYDIGDLLKFTEIKEGLINKIFLIETRQGKFILKIAIEHSPEMVNYEIELLNHLQDLPVPKPIQTKHKKYVADYDNFKAFIYEYLPGEHVTDISTSILKSISQFLANMHRQTEDFISSVKKYETLSFSEKSIKEIINRSKNIKDKASLEALKYIEENIFKYLPSADLPQGAIHVDIKSENLLFKKNELTGVVDFDNAFDGPLILDLAVAFKWFCFRQGEFQIKDARIFCRTYQKIRPLTSLEKQSL